MKVDPKLHAIFIDGKYKTDQIRDYSKGIKKSCVYFRGTETPYFYSNSRVVFKKSKKCMDSQNYIVLHNGKPLHNVTYIGDFSRCGSNAYYVEYGNGEHLYGEENEVVLVDESVSEKSKICKETAPTTSSTVSFENKSGRSILSYFRDVAEQNPLENDNGKKILVQYYQDLMYQFKESALSTYIEPRTYHVHKYNRRILIYPFGLNKSQHRAVEKAFESQISVIEGPPGTGKTQTILNIIANLIVQEKRVLVVSNNNSAIKNVIEKLASNQLDFMTALLGNFKNSELFIKEQLTEKSYPEKLNEWIFENKAKEKIALKQKIKQETELLRETYTNIERHTELTQNLRTLRLEYKHYKLENECNNDNVVSNVSWTSDFILRLINELDILHNEKPCGLWKRIKLFFIRYRVRKLILRHFAKYDDNEECLRNIIINLYVLYYDKKISEIEEEIAELVVYLENHNVSEKLKKIPELSMAYLKHCVADKYIGREKVIFNNYSIHHIDRNFMDEYPIVLSTTFSSRHCVDGEKYDYVIMDEASQVSSETGILALSCAKNAVIVGDRNQLPNVITDDDRKKIEEIGKKHNIQDCYNCVYGSFLDSICSVLPEIPVTLLREHYRCHPRIIDFCNRKFYNGELRIMTKDEERKDVMAVVKTVSGNHSRGTMNMREIDVITEEILPSLVKKTDDIGIITPFNAQVHEIKKRLHGDQIEVATVHKFQGREKSAIIMSTVEDEINDFVDNPNLLNVAISRAKDFFILVLSGNPQKKGLNISDLVDYIEYNGFSIKKSNIKSIYDSLYKQNREVRLALLKKYGRVSEYDSENLTYAMLMSLFQRHSKYVHLGVVTHLPLTLLVTADNLLDDEELMYLKNPWTHVDFVIYNKVSRKPVLAIETDGYAFHHSGTEQHDRRDRLKNSIFEKSDMPYLRLSTIESGEEKRVSDMLDSIAESSCTKRCE